MSIFLSADSHFGHSKIIEYSKRPFANADEMDEALITNWNNCVRKGDTVYHLGDFSFRNLKRTQNIIRRLNGGIHLILGNHDRLIRNNINIPPSDSWFQTISDYKELKVSAEIFEPGKIILSHYPFLIWNKSHFGSIHLCGHSHGSLKQEGRRMDVGVDTNNYTPYLLDDIITKLSKIEVINYDRHQKRKKPPN